MRETDHTNILRLGRPVVQGVFADKVFEKVHGNNKLVQRNKKFTQQKGLDVNDTYGRNKWLYQKIQHFHNDLNLKTIKRLRGKDNPNPINRPHVLIHIP